VIAITVMIGSIIVISDRIVSTIHHAKFDTSSRDLPAQTAKPLFAINLPNWLHPCSTGGVAVAAARRTLELLL
jgi:hypothetical protein